MRLQDLIQELRPTTLAAVCVDIENIGSGASGDLIQFGRQCERALEIHVGADEAQMMIEQEAGCMVEA